MKPILSTLILAAVLLAACAPSGMPTTAPTSGAVDFPTQALPTDMPTDAPTLTPTAAPTVEPTASAPATASNQVAYVGRDGNLWLVDAVTGEKKQLTADASTYNTTSPQDVVDYQFPLWSSDGRYLSAVREYGKVIASGYDFSYSMVIIDLASGESRIVLEGIKLAGYAWKPGTHLISYALSADPNYFTARGVVDATLATGINFLDLDSGVSGELVKPEAGLSLVDPRWSPDGQFLSFAELVYMEGRGPFAYYDFGTSKYVRWEKAIGNVDWNLDGSQLLFDNLNYIPNYTERVSVINRDKSGERQLTQDAADAYSYNPLFSPDGKQVAYLDVTGYDPNTVIKLMVMDYPDGQPRQLATLTQAYTLHWTPDGKGLLVVTGVYPDTQVVLVSAADGAQQALAEGSQAVMQP